MSNSYTESNRLSRARTRRVFASVVMVIAGTVWTPGCGAPAQTSKTASNRQVLTKDDIPQDLPKDIRQIVERMLSPSPAEREKAAKDLRPFGRRAAPAIPFLVRLLGDYEGVNAGGVCPDMEAYLTLQSLGRYAVIPLTECLAGRGRRGRDRAAALLGAIGDIRAVPTLIRALDDEDARVRRWGAFAFCGIPDRRAVNPLIHLLGDSDGDCVQSAMLALGRIRDPKAVDPLVAVLLNEDVAASARRDAASALGRIGDARALPPLLTSVRAPGIDRNVRIAALMAIGELRDRRAFETLRDALSDNDPTTRDAAAIGLAALGDPRALPFLVAIMRDKSEGSPRTGVVYSLVASGDAFAIDAVIRQFEVDRDDAFLRAHAASALALSKKSRAYLRAAAALKEGDSNARREVTRTLATGVSLMSEPVDGCGSEGRRAVPAAIHDPRVRESLEHVAADNDEDDETRKFAKEALQERSDKWAEMGSEFDQ